MTDVVSPLLQWLNANPQLAGLVTFTISAAESVAIIGTIVPGSIMMTALGALAGAGVIPLWETIIWAILGAIVGDGISYWIGFYFKSRLPRLWPFRTYPYLLKSGEKFVHKYGYMSVFIGRFVGPVRALVPLVAGMLGMKPWKFIVANITSAIGWAPAYMLPGILLGAASLELPPDIAVHVMLVLLLISLFVLLCLWFAYKLIQLFLGQTTQLQNEIWHGLKKSRYFSITVAVLKHHDASKKRGQLSLAFYFVLVSVLFLFLSIYVKLAGAANLMVNDAIFHFFRGIRVSSVDNLMLDITLLGQKEVVLPVVLVIFAWLVFCKRWRAAFHALALGVLAAGSVFVIKNIIRSPRPWGIMAGPETFSMPSGHAALSTTVYMGLAFLIALSLRSQRRWMIYIPAIIIALAVGISRLYLGAHWFTDIIASWLLSASLLLFVIISYQRHKEKPINPVSVTLVTLAALCITFGCYHHRYFEHMKFAYGQIDYPQAVVTMNQWWQGNDVLPAYSSSLFGFPSSKINLEWAGDVDQIKASLLQEGWTPPPERDFITVLHRIADIKSTQYLSLVSPQYLDKSPELILVRTAADKKNPLVLRLWNSNRIVKETNETLWVGFVGMIPRSYSWLIKSRPGEINIDPVLVFPTKKASAAWQWKAIVMNNSPNRSTLKMLFVRENKTVHKKI